MSSPVCILCKTTENLKYCKLCDKYFCPTCEKNYPARVNAMLHEKVWDPIGDVFKWLGGQRNISRGQ